MAAWDPGTVYLVLASIMGIIILIVSLLSRGDNNKKKTGQRSGRANEAHEVGGVRRRRNRMQVGRRAHNDDEEEIEEEDFEEDDGAPFGLVDQPSGKIGAKKLKRLEMKAEKRAMREQMEAEREDKKRRDELQEQERIKDEARRKIEQERLEEEERLKKEEQERKEHEEYLLLKESFVVEDEGVGETEEESRALLQEFVDYIKKSKVVLLEDLACEFGLRTQDAIGRLQSLQEMERITGVIDDRGKFIYISPEELEAVAKFIKQRGRVTISELAECSNQLINLQTEKVPDTRNTVEASA